MMMVAMPYLSHSSPDPTSLGNQKQYEKDQSNSLRTENTFAKKSIKEEGERDLSESIVTQIDDLEPYCPVTRYVPWKDHEFVFRSRSLWYTLNYTPKTWNLDPNEEYWNSIEDVDWLHDDITDKQREVLTGLGYNEDRWDCCINHYNAYDWGDLVFWEYKEQIAAWEALGWSESTYGTLDAKNWPESEYKTWENLSEYEREMAASKLCYTEETWNEDKPLEEWPEDFEYPDAW